MTRPTVDRYPTGPLLQLAEHEARRLELDDDNGRIAAHVIAELIGAHTKTVHRYRNGRPPSITWELADRYAVALGRHPSEIWPQWFPTEHAEEHAA